MRDRVSFRVRGKFHDVVRTFQKTRKKLHETGSNRFEPVPYPDTSRIARHNRQYRTATVIKPFFLHVHLGLGSVFVLGFTTDDRIRVTNPNPN